VTKRKPVWVITYRHPDYETETDVVGGTIEEVTIDLGGDFDVYPDGPGRDREAVEWAKDHLDGLTNPEGPPHPVRSPAPLTVRSRVADYLAEWIYSNALNPPPINVIEQQIRSGYDDDQWGSE